MGGLCAVGSAALGEGVAGVVGTAGRLLAAVRLLDAAVDADSRIEHGRKPPDQQGQAGKSHKFDGDARQEVVTFFVFDADAW